MNEALRVLKISYKISEFENFVNLNYFPRFENYLMTHIHTYVYTYVFQNEKYQNYFPSRKTYSGIQFT